MVKTQHVLTQLGGQKSFIWHKVPLQHQFWTCGVLFTLWLGLGKHQINAVCYLRNLMYIIYGMYVKNKLILTFGHILDSKPDLLGQSPVFDPFNHPNHLMTWTFLALYTTAPAGCLQKWCQRGTTDSYPGCRIWCVGSENRLENRQLFANMLTIST